MQYRAAHLISDGETFTDIQGDPATGLGIPMAVWVMVVVAIVAPLLLNRTKSGRWLYATGGNERGKPGTGESGFQYILGVLDSMGHTGFVGLEYRPDDPLSRLPHPERG